MIPRLVMTKMNLIYLYRKAYVRDMNYTFQMWVRTTDIIPGHDNYLTKESESVYLYVFPYIAESTAKSSLDFVRTDNKWSPVLIDAAIIKYGEAIPKYELYSYNPKPELEI